MDLAQPPQAGWESGAHGLSKVSLTGWGTENGGTGLVPPLWLSGVIIDEKEQKTSELSSQVRLSRGGW